MVPGAQNACPARGARKDRFACRRRLREQDDCRAGKDDEAHRRPLAKSIRKVGYRRDREGCDAARPAEKRSRGSRAENRRDHHADQTAKCDPLVNTHAGQASWRRSRFRASRLESARSATASSPALQIEQRASASLRSSLTWWGCISILPSTPSYSALTRSPKFKLWIVPSQDYRSNAVVAAR